jgi:hypothetical protein
MTRRRVVPYLREVPDYLTGAKTPQGRSKRRYRLGAPTTHRDHLERLRRAVRR